jgi:hypothetical protein
LDLQFKVIKLLKAAIPVKSLITLRETSKLVTPAASEFRICPFNPSESIPNAMSLASKLASRIAVVWAWLFRLKILRNNINKNIFFMFLRLRMMLMFFH